MTEEEPKMRIFLNTNITMSRGKAAAHAVHAALKAVGAHPGIPVVVLGAKPRDIEAMRTTIHDAGHTELDPGTLTAGTEWTPLKPTQDERINAVRSIRIGPFGPNTKEIILSGGKTVVTPDEATQIIAALDALEAS